MPGTMTRSCRRTQAAVRTGSMALPSTLSAAPATPGARTVCDQAAGTASMPCCCVTHSAPEHSAST